MDTIQVMAIKRLTMTHVLHLIQYPGQGGSERYILSLAEKLHGKSCRFFLAHGGNGPLVEAARAMGMETFLLPMKSPWDLAAARGLKRYCRDKGITVVHTHFLRENYVSILSRILGNRVRLVNTVHMMDEKTGLTRAVNRLMTRFDKHIIAVSRAVQSVQLTEGVPSSKISIIYNGVDIQPHIEHNPSLRERFHIAADAFLITSVARFTEEKGHLFLMDAIKAFLDDAKAHPDSRLAKAHFLLTGEGPLAEPCREKARKLDIDSRILFTGYCSDVSELLYASDLFLSHSRSEALGIAILEALACGLPVVATDSGGPSEIVNRETGCGILVAKEDAAGFARAMKTMIMDTGFHASCREKAKALIKSAFSLDHMAAETLRLYQDRLP